MGAIIPQVVSEDRASGAQIVDGGLRFDSGKSNALTRTPSSVGNKTIFTWSGWVKRNIISVRQYIFSATSGGNSDAIYFHEDNTLRVHWDDGLDGVLVTTQLFRDPSAWYHLLWSVDFTQSTSTNRVKLYVNGTQITAFSTSTYPSQNYANGDINNTVAHAVGRRQISSPDYYLSAQLSNAYLIDGQALDASYFGYTDPLTNVWRPKKFKPQATPNDGTVWSSGTITNTGGGIYSGSWANVFDGDFSITNNNWVYVYSNSTSRLTFPKALSGLIEIYGTNGATSTTDSAGTDTIVLSDGSTYDVSAIPVSNGVWYSFGQKTGITYIEIRHNSATGQGTVLRSIRVNGVPLLDSDITNMGANAFYLPFDGSAPIGQDQSGRGNNWTPVNFGGSNTIEKATGALPILNTDGGGKVARVGVRTDANASSLVLALPLVGIKSDFSNAVNSGTSNKAITANGNAAASSAQSNFYGGSWYFDGTGDFLEITPTTDFALPGNFTIECWFYAPALSGNYALFSIGSYTNGLYFRTGESGVNTRLTVYMNNSQIALTSSGTVVAAQWNHFAVVRSGSTVNLFINGILSASGTSSFSIPAATTYVGRAGHTTGEDASGYFQDVRVYKGLAKYTSNFIPASTDPDIVPDSPSGVSYSSNVALVPSTDGAVAFDGDGDYLTTSGSSDYAFGTGDFTIECFVYTTTISGTARIVNQNLSNVDSGYGTFLLYRNGSSLLFYSSTSNGSWNIVSALSIGTISPNVWTHIVVTRQSGTVYTWKDGIQQASVSAAGNINDSTGNVFIGKQPGSGNTDYWSGFISNFHLVKGTALYTANFTPPTAPISSVANTKLLCCKSNSSATAADVTPGSITANGNAAASNFNPFTVNINTQRGKQSGYATWNPLDKHPDMSVSNGNLTASVASPANWRVVRSNIGITTGKWYWESLCSGTYMCLGINTQDARLDDSVDSFGKSYAYCYDGVTRTGTLPNPSYGGTFGTGDLISVAFDADNKTLTFYKNGINLGVAFSNINVGSGSTTTWFPYVTHYTNTSSFTNFGQKPFKFPPPAGFQPLTLANTPRPTIVRPDQYVGIVTYTGNGTNGRQINVGWKPDLVWIKGRENMSDGFPYDHNLYDTVRGAGKNLRSNNSAAENTNDQYGYISSFTNTGFTVTGGSTDDYYVNDNGKNFVAWCWKAGGNSNTFNINDVGYATASAAGLTAGTITPTGASVNTKSGFSIIKVPGTASAASFSHGLGQAPAFVILKETNGTGDWQVGHKSLSSGAWTSRLGLNLTTAEETTISAWNNTPPTSSLITVGATSNVDNNFIVYAWAEIPGFSKFGSYSGNNSADGPVVITGFRPRWILWKNSSAESAWTLMDTERSRYNAAVARLRANGSDTENTTGTGSTIDILSNGFKVRTTGTDINDSTNVYIYAAFAETPTQNLYGAQANAR